MLNVFTLVNGRLVQEEIDSDDSTATHQSRCALKMHTHGICAGVSVMTVGTRITADCDAIDLALSSPVSGRN
jgi:pyruvate/oxaloacetate carboxyltransferase